MRTAEFGLGLTIAAVIVIAASGCQPKETDTVNFGAILSLTGAAAPYGEDNRRGLELAQEVVNESGGIGGKSIKIDVQDSAGDPAQSVSLIRHFAGDQRNLAVLGPTRTGEAIAAARALPQLNIAMMSVGSTGDWKSAAGNFNAWTFRSTRVDTYLIEPLLRAARDKFGVRRIAILSTSNDDYSASVLPVYRAAANVLGLQIVAQESQTAGDTDRAPQLTKIKSLTPDALIINTLSSEAPLIAEQARRLGISARFIGTAGFSSPATWKLASQHALDGTLVGDNFFVGSNRPVVKEFVRRYRMKFQNDPPAYAAYAYDGLLLLADAARRAGPVTDRQKLRQALSETKNFEGVLGTLTYHGSGDAEKTPIVLQIVNQRYELVR